MSDFGEDSPALDAVAGANLPPAVDQIHEAGAARHIPQWLVRSAGMVGIGLLLVTGFNGDGSAAARLTPQQIAASTIAQRVAWIDKRCSAYLLTNPSTGEVDGVETAGHCGWYTKHRGSTAQWVEGDNGREYVVYDGKGAVEVGPDAAHLKTIGILSEVIAPSNHEPESDLVLGVLQGHTFEQVLADYAAQSMSVEELTQLAPGTSIFMGGYPAQQQETTQGVMARQEVNMSFAGIEYVTIDPATPTKGAWVWAAANPNENDAACTPGASGSEGFVIKDGRASSVGTLTAYYDLDIMAGAREHMKKLFPDINWDNYRYACGFSPVLPDQRLIIAHSIKDVPGITYLTPDQAGLLFYTNNYHAPVVNGIIEFYEGGSKGGGPGPQLVSIDHPIIWTNRDDSLVVGYYMNGALQTISLDARSVKFYQVNNQTPLGFESLQRTYDPPVNADSFVTDDGRAFGRLFQQTPDEASATTYQLEQGSDGQWAFIALKP